MKKYLKDMKLGETVKVKVGPKSNTVWGESTSLKDENSCLTITPYTVNVTDGYFAEFQINALCFIEDIKIFPHLDFNFLTSHNSFASKTEKDMKEIYQDLDDSISVVENYVYLVNEEMSLSLSANFDDNGPYIEVEE